MKPTIPLATASHCCHHSATTATGALRHEHEVILRALALLERVTPGMAAGAPAARTALPRLVEFFRTFADRCHHAKEEQHLFPALERRGVPREGGPVGVMLVEHDQGRRLLAAMLADDPRAAVEAAQTYIALLRAHIDKENDVLFALAEQVLADEEQQGLLRAFDAVEREAVGPGVHERLLAELDALEQELAGGVPTGQVLDVRAMPPRERHPRIFATFDRLAPGAHFVLVNDHDPKPLYYQFAAERPGAFTWRYLEEGPEVWRVEIGKPPA
jgi:hemerythrin-like domain-containing protein/uncharacterized protein (DUF2249 family)